MKLANKVALITGAGSGIGLGAARRFAAEGAKIGALGNRESEIESVARELQEAGGEAMPLLADVSDPEEMKGAIEKLIGKWGRLDIVFANAGINGVWAPLEELEPEEWDRTLNINLRGTFLTVKYSLPYLKKNGGSVVVTSSVNGTRNFSSSGSTAYSCSKGAQVVFTKITAIELARHKIRINAICPGGIVTRIGENTEKRNLQRIQIPVQFPEGHSPLTGDKSGTIEQVAELALFLASDDSSHITGTELYIDGGESLLIG